MKRLVTKSRMLVLTLCLCLGGCTGGSEFGSTRAGAEEQAELSNWEVGTTYRYEARLSADAEFTPTTTEGFDFELTATAAVTPVRVAGDRTELLLQFEGLRLHSKSGQQVSQQELLEQQLGAPYLFTLERGKLLESRLGRDVGAEAGSILRSLSSAFQIAAEGATGADTWKATEHDATGTYTSEYRRDGRVLKKKKLEYSHVHFSGDIPDAMRRSVLPRVLESEITLTPREGSLHQVALREHIQSALAMGQTVKVRTTLDLRQVGRAPAKPIDVDGLHASTRQVAANLPIVATVRKDRFDDMKIGGNGFEDLLAVLDAEYAELRKLDAEQPAADLAGGAAKRNADDARNENVRARLQAFSAMGALLRQDPSALPKALAQVRSNPVVRDPLLDAIGAAGTPEAQRALIELMTDTSLGDELRMSAAMSVIRTKEPNAATVAALSKLVNDPLLREHAIYGLGTASRRMRAAGLNAPATDASDALLEALASAKDDGTLKLALRGISNSADVRALPAVEPFLTHASHGVRHAAIDALRLMKHGDADAWIAERLLKDENAAVQAAAVSAADDREPSARLADALAVASLKGKSAIVRHRAVELATRWLDAQPELTSTLEQVAKAESEKAIRELAANALANRKSQR